MCRTTESTLRPITIISCHYGFLLVETNVSLPPGFWLTSPAGWLPRTGISSGTLRSAVEYGLPLPVVPELSWPVVWSLTDLTGSKDGTVRLWEWGHQQSINELRKPGAFPKVTKVLFNAQGNKVWHSPRRVCSDPSRSCSIDLISDFGTKFIVCLFISYASPLILFFFTFSLLISFLTCHLSNVSLTSVCLLFVCLSASWLKKAVGAFSWNLYHRRGSLYFERLGLGLSLRVGVTIIAL